MAKPLNPAPSYGKQPAPRGPLRPSLPNPVQPGSPNCPTTPNLAPPVSKARGK